VVGGPETERGSPKQGSFGRRHARDMFTRIHNRVIFLALAANSRVAFRVRKGMATSTLAPVPRSGPTIARGSPALDHR